MELFIYGWGVLTVILAVANYLRSTKPRTKKVRKMFSCTDDNEYINLRMMCIKKATQAPN